MIVLDDLGRAQRRIRIGHFESSESLHDRIDLAQTRVELVLVVDERILARLTQRPQTVQLLVDILNLRAQQLRLNARLMMLLALVLHFLPLVHNQLDLIVEQARLGLLDLGQLPQQLVPSLVQHTLRLVERLVNRVNNSLHGAIQIPDLVLHVRQRQVETVYALIRLEQVDLGHALDGYRERHDYVVGIRGRLEMRLAYRTKRLVARLAVQQLFVRVIRTPWYDVT